MQLDTLQICLVQGAGVTVTSFIILYLSTCINSGYVILILDMCIVFVAWPQPHAFPMCVVVCVCEIGLLFCEWHSMRG